MAFSVEHRAFSRQLKEWIQQRAVPKDEAERITLFTKLEQAHAADLIALLKDMWTAGKAKCTRSTVPAAQGSNPSRARRKKVKRNSKQWLFKLKL